MGRLAQAIRDNDPVMFLEHKAVYDVTGEVPEESYTIPVGAANVVRAGDGVARRVGLGGLGGRVG